jgi:hypothetical protein
MEEIAIRGLVQRNRIAYFNFEMNLYSMNQRIYRRLSGFGNEGVTLYPIFDCLSNQTGVCDKSERKSKVSVKKKASDKPSFNPEYIPCDVCRGISRDFIPDVWYESVTAPIYEYRTVKKKMRDFKEMYSDSFRLWCYPRFSASIDDMLRDLDYVERFDNFIPDIIVADYANIMKPAKGDRQEGYQAIDDIWKRLAGLAGERHCLVITGSQGTRGSLKKTTKEEDDVPEWIGILGHVDVFAAINQTPEEKKKGMLRWNVIEHRHRNFNPLDCVITLNQLSTGQVLLDSEFSV